MARIRTLPKAIEEIRAKDPGTCITINALRQWVKEGRVKSNKAGRYILVDVDEIEQFVVSGAAYADR